MIVKIPKKDTCFECDNCRGIYVLPAVAKTIAKITLEYIKEYLESLIGRQEIGFHSGSFYIDHVNTLRIILEQCAEFRSSLHRLFIAFEKVFDSANRECIWCALRRRGIPEKLIAIRTIYDGATY